MAFEGAENRELAGCRAVVTGSSSGIGRAIVVELAAAGANVVVHCRKSEAAAEAVGQLAREQGVRSFVLMADLRDAAACARLVDQTWQSLGGCDIWVNNAGADTLTGTAARLSFDEKLAELLAVDVRATMLFAREAGQRMKTRSEERRVGKECRL